MKKYIALFRGINVGGKSKVEMKKLKITFEGLGLVNVLTYINSGNVVFESDQEGGLSEVIEKAIEEDFGFLVKTLVMEAKKMHKICETLPDGWENNTEMKTDVLFLWGEYDSKKSLALLGVNEEVDNVKYILGAIIWNVKRKDYRKSGMKKFIGSILYKNMTARSVNTVRKLVSMC